MQTFLAAVSIGCLGFAGLIVLLRVYVWVVDRWHENREPETDDE